MTGPKPWMSTLTGWMSPRTSPANIAYGTDAIAARGVISGSAPTVMPSNRIDPSNTTSSSAISSPSCTEKKPSSKSTVIVSDHSSMPSTSAS